MTRLRQALQSEASIRGARAPLASSRADDTEISQVKSL
jgi:hypothetical protein